MKENRITPEVIAATSAQHVRISKNIEFARPGANAYRIGHFRGDVERALFLQKLAHASEEAADGEQTRAAGAGRERRHHGYRRWHGDRVQDRIAQSSELHRAVSRSGHGRRRNPARHLYDGRTADCGDGFDPLRAVSTIRERARGTARLLEGVVSGIAHYGNCFGVPTVGGECVFEECYDGNPLVNVFALGVFRHDEDFLRQSERRRQPGDLCRREDGPRRHSRGIDGFGRVYGRIEAEAPERAGGRSVYREASARGMPGGDADGRDCRHSGHGRGRPDIVRLARWEAAPEPASRSICRSCRSAKRG